MADADDPALDATAVLAAALRGYAVVDQGCCGAVWMFATAAARLCRWNDQCRSIRASDTQKMSGFNYLCADIAFLSSIYYFPRPASRTAELIADAVAGGRLSCLVCLDSVRFADKVRFLLQTTCADCLVQIWSCEQCHESLHLACIQQWVAGARLAVPAPEEWHWFTSPIRTHSSCAPAQSAARRTRSRVARPSTTATAAA